MHKTVEVKFDNSTFISGSNLTGSVELILTEDTQIREIRLIIEGLAKCKWTEGSKPRKTTHKGFEKYLYEEIYLLDHIQIVPAGISTYKFSCLLPQELPSSQIEKYGKVKYRCFVKISRPWKFLEKLKFPFKVINNVDLNSIPLLMTPKIEEIQENLTNADEPLIMKASIPRSGYLPDQLIEITINYDNQSNVKIRKTNVLLEKIIHYKSIKEDVEKVKVTCLIQKIDKGVSVKKACEFKVQLKVPVTPNTNESFCNILITKYRLKIQPEATKYQCDSCIIFPIIIGNPTIQ